MPDKDFESLDKAFASAVNAAAYLRKKTKDTKMSIHWFLCTLAFLETATPTSTSCALTATVRNRRLLCSPNEWLRTS